MSSSHESNGNNGNGHGTQSTDHQRVSVDPSSSSENTFQILKNNPNVTNSENNIINNDIKTEESSQCDENVTNDNTINIKENLSKKRNRSDSDQEKIQDHGRLSNFKDIELTESLKKIQKKSKSGQSINLKPMPNFMPLHRSKKEESLNIEGSNEENSSPATPYEIVMLLNNQQVMPIYSDNSKEQSPIDPKSIDGCIGVLIPSFRSSRREIFLTQNPTTVSTGNQIHSTNIHQRMTQFCIAKNSQNVVTLSNCGNQSVYLNDVLLTSSKPLKSGDKITILGKNVYFDFPISVSTPVQTPNTTEKSIGDNMMDVEQETSTSPLQKDKITKETFIHLLRKISVDPSSIENTFETIPYPLNPNFVKSLKNLVRIYLTKPSFVQYTSNFITSSRRILLSGPQGSELMQDEIIKALAKDYSSKLIILDDLLMDEEVIDKSTQNTPNLEDTISAPSNLKVNDQVIYCKKNSSGKVYVYKKGKVIRVLSNPNKIALGFDAPTNDHNVIVVDISSIRLKPQPYKMGRVLLFVEALRSFLKKTEERIIVYFRGSNNFIRVSAYDLLKKTMDRCDKKVVFICSVLNQDPPKREKQQISFGHFSNFVKSEGTRNLSTILTDTSAFESIRDHQDRKLMPNRSIENQPNKFIHLFPTKLKIIPPEGDTSLWKKKLDIDHKKYKYKRNMILLQGLLTRNRIFCDPIKRNKHFLKKLYTLRDMEHITAYAISDSLKNYPDTTLEDSENRLVINPLSLDAGIESHCILSGSEKLKDSVLDSVDLENEFEKKIAEDVIPPHEIDISFEDIGALDHVKKVLIELVMLPLQRPELFRGSLVKPCKGILLFGPPGTGKTMLAKAIATESSANFINISMSSIASKWFGDGEKFVKAIFTLASKLSPCVVFIDEVDSFLSKREKGGSENDAMRKIKNEFMSLWDGLKSKENERILILAATNRPFDLDEAVLRRLPRRLLVDLPDQDNREKIFNVILSKEEVDQDVDVKELGMMTDGFSGSDIKHMCIEAAHEPIREYILKEKNGLIEKKEEEEDENDDDFWLDEQKERKLNPPLRKIKMDDFKVAKKKISASVQENSKSISELREWNEMYGEGGNRMKIVPSYFM